ncbi:MAG: hypothetical protein NT106_05845 [Candidatus Sumerlaeota bacterium]|nr:hypothetical protein [Candidatus Sumerlaeota bacterium]
MSKIRRSFNVGGNSLRIQILLIPRFPISPILRFFSYSLAFCAILIPFTAHGSSIQKFTMPEMTKLADVIAVGQVEKMESRWVDKHIETTLQIKAKEYWKGDMGPSFELTQMGGDVIQPLPIAMHADGEPRFFEGERVVLFLEKPKGKSGTRAPSTDAQSKLAISMRVVGWAQGKFTILNDPKTGEEKAVCLGVQNARILDKREMEKLCAVAAEFEKMRISKEGEPTKAEKAATFTTPLTKNPLLTAGRLKTSMGKMDAKSASPQYSKDTLSSLDLPSQKGLNEFKAEVIKELK